VTTVTTGTSVLTDAGGNVDIVLAEAVTEAEAVEDALSEGEGNAAILGDIGTETLVSHLANTAMPLILPSEVRFVLANSLTKDS